MAWVREIDRVRNTLLAKRGEKVDYLGIILSGKLLIKQYDRVYGFMGMGDMIGYMAWVGLKGTDEHKFNILGEKEGYVAILPYDVIKLMNKRDPSLVNFQFKMFKILTKISKLSNSCLDLQPHLDVLQA